MWNAGLVVLYRWFPRIRGRRYISLRYVRCSLLHTPAIVRSSSLAFPAMASEEKKQLTYYHKQRIQLADELLLMISTIIAYLELAYTESPPKVESPPPDADRGKELYAAREVWSLGDVIASAQDLGLGEDNTDLKNIEWRRCRLDFLK